MKEEVRKLVEKVSNDTELKNKFKNAKDVNEILAIAKEAGFNFTEEDLRITKDNFEEKMELSSKELEKVAGGAGCGCLVGGYGSGHNKVGTFECVCAINGFGAYLYYGDRPITSPGNTLTVWKSNGTNNGLCACIGAGAGASHESSC